jgi:uncharacterized membrane protein YfcA
MGAVMFVGAYLGRRVLDRMTERGFVRVVEALVMGLGLLLVIHPPR